MKKIVWLLLIVASNVFAKPVNINTADAQTIADSLTNIGIKKAEAIVKDRQEHGSFKTADELDRVSGIGKKTIEANRADILITATKSAAAPAASKSAIASNVKK